MKKITKLTALILSFAMVFSSCEPDKLMLFNEHPDVYFTDYWQLPDNSSDIKLVHMELRGDSTVVGIRISVTGGPVGRDRWVNVSHLSGFTFDNQGNVVVATEGRHFRYPKRVLIPANAMQGVIPVTLFTSNLHILRDRLPFALVLENSEDFTTNFKTAFVEGNIRGERNMLEWAIYVSNILVRPLFWNNNMYGPFSIKKYRLICEWNQLPLSAMDGVPWPGQPDGGWTAIFGLDVGKVAHSWLEYLAKGDEEEGIPPRPVYENCGVCKDPSDPDAPADAHDEYREHVSFQCQCASPRRMVMGPSSL